MNPLAKAFFEAAPFLLAFALFSLLPKGRSWAERLCIGAVAGPILTHLTNAPNSPELIGQLLGGGDAASKGGLGGLISNFAGGLLGGKK